ncbi:uncharacterized protein GGS22DRAFT_171440 [Annulohypoxylon maeteangense]|uniref:uncharacterized protein n=1 Tax=Annulohypoxylon maeteangense TaxID=1927788 RepID=UPI002008057C|nr:uncharacterized protein GGS22DRAFT_171440 [Annulohypoxylon maeteangense]KAI0882062.1 hypothetical protein GGS22DRAFT_171440 [Annulohypoxylon maeteangense]
MCHKNIFTYVYPDGHKGKHIKHDLCDNSRSGQPCKHTKTFEHPIEYVRPAQLSPQALTHGQFPPTPPLSSHSASASDSEHSSKERSGVYINGEKVIDLNRRQSRRDKGDRTVYVDGSSLSRTPPRRYSVSRSSPSSSPREEATYLRESRRRERTPESRERSTSSHYRGPIIEVKVVNEKQRDRDHSTHRRHGSSTKSSSQSGDDEERRRRRRDSHVRFEDDHKGEDKKKKIQSAIERQNADIANRPAVPSQSASNGRYRRGSVVVDRANTELVTAMEQLELEREKSRREKRTAELLARDAEEAQKQRLKNRLAPTRQTPVVQSQTRPRPKLLYEDPYYQD